MRILIVGGSGVIGTRLISRLVDGGHEVVATTRRIDNIPRLVELGAHGVQLDVYDAGQTADVVAAASPDLIIDELTDLSSHDTDANARIRREGTANLVDAALKAGVDRMIVQSIAWVFPDGQTPATEEEEIVAGSAVDTMEALTRRMPHWTVLRCGMLYGPTTWYAPDGPVAASVRAGEYPATGQITSFVHIDDAVAATVQSIGWPDGIYHIVDDEPAPGATWVPEYARRIGAPQPKLDESVTGGRPISNAKARAAGWSPAYPSWRDGFPAG